MLVAKHERILIIVFLCISMIFAATMVLIPNVNAVANSDRHLNNVEQNDTSSKNLNFHDDSYLTFTAVESNSSLSLKWASGSDVFYSIDGAKTWIPYVSGQQITLLKIGDIVKFKGSNICTDSHNHFSMMGKIASSGSVTSLVDQEGLNPNVELVPSNFSYMFYECRSLVSAPEINAYNLGDSCCYDMYAFCTSLVKVPEFTAKKFGNSCCGLMFHGCTGFTKIEFNINADILGDNCLYSMFQLCESITEVNFTINANKLDNKCCYWMFLNCVSLKTVNFEINSDTLGANCFLYAFSCCLSLKTANFKVISENIEESCFSGFFQNCSVLESVNFNINTTCLGYESCSGMFNMCKNLKHCDFNISAGNIDRKGCNKMFVTCNSLENVSFNINADILGDECCSNMFTSCERLTSVESSSITAQLIGESCFGFMFSKCTALQSTDLILNINNAGEKCCYCMFYQCTSLIEALRLNVKNYANNCFEYMFQNCTSLKIAEDMPWIDKQKIFTCLETSPYENSVNNMFLDTAGLFTGTPKPNKTYYWYTPLKNITLNFSKYIISEGDSFMLELFLDPPNTAEDEFTWENSDADVVSVQASNNKSYSAKIDAIAQGDAVITVKSVYDPSITATCSVTVIPKSNITLDPNGGTTKKTSISANYNNPMPALSKEELPTRKGYTFNGYYSDNEAGVKYYNADGTSATILDKTDHEFTLYAHWTEIPAKEEDSLDVQDSLYIDESFSSVAENEDYITPGTGDDFLFMFSLLMCCLILGLSTVLKRILTRNNLA